MEARLTLEDGAVVVKAVPNGRQFPSLVMWRDDRSGQVVDRFFVNTDDKLQTGNYREVYLVEVEESK